MNIKLIWFYLSCFFVTNYALSILKLIAYVPLPTLPNWFNLIALILSYSCLLIVPRDKLLSPLSIQNALCIILFITAPSQILLFPFFIIAIYHVNLRILTQKKLWEKSLIYKVAMVLGQYSVQIARLSFYAELYCFVLSIPLVFIGKCKIATFILYFVIIRQQYVGNPTMRDIVNKIRMHIYSRLTPIAEKYPMFKKTVEYVKIEDISKKKN